MNSVKRLSLIACMVTLSGCGSLATKTGIATTDIESEKVASDKVASENKASAKKSASEKIASKNSAPTTDSVIAQDFVRTMVQIKSLAPSSTVLHFQPTEAAKSLATLQADCVVDNFGQALKTAAAKSGYNVQTAYSKPSNISFSVAEFDEENAELGCVYNLTVTDVDFRRVYKLSDSGTAKPQESMLVRGADVSHIETDDSIFDLGDDVDTNAGSEFDSPVAQNDINRRKANEQRTASEVELLIVKPGKLPGETEKVALSPEDEAEMLGLTIDSISQRDSTIETDESSVRNNNGFASVPKKNVADMGLSNFEEELADKKNVAEEILIFSDDSYVLGERNKQLLGSMVNSFNPETDVVSVVGCSTGVTQIEHGNAALAIGRANRVKEALLYSGVPHDKIFEEGCWSPTPNSTPFPNRGVVITVKRATEEG